MSLSKPGMRIMYSKTQDSLLIKFDKKIRYACTVVSLTHSTEPLKIIKLQKSEYLSKFALSKRCVRLLLIKGPDTFFELKQKK